MRRAREDFYCALCHLLNALPLWGLVGCGLIWYFLREESRRVIIHAQRAVTFHTLLLGAILIYIILDLVSRLMIQLVPGLFDYLRTLNHWLIRGLVAGYVMVCLYGFVRCLMGHSFHYPGLKRP